MAKSLNLCQFIGNLGEDPNIRYLQDGKAVASISIGVSDDYKDKNGNMVQQTNWVRVTAFGRLAEIMGEYLKKGSKIYVSGKQVTRKYQAQDGSDRYATEINASEMQMLDSRQGDQSSAQPQQNNQQRSQGQQRQSNPPPQNAGGFNDYDDEINF